VRKVSQAGFTVTELALSITVAGFMAAVIFAATFYYYANTSQVQAATDMALESQSILSQFTDDIRLAGGIASNNAIADANAPVGGWTTSDPSNIIIIESPAIDVNRNIIYDPNTGSPYTNEYIYFLSGTTMYKRTLKNTAATGNTAVTTCPANLATASCPADRVFSSNASNLSFTFYDISDSTTANATAARSVSLTINMSKKAFGKSITLNNTTRATLRNL
jgi:type II secretory pathway pseudopilin PulG